MKASELRIGNLVNSYLGQITVNSKNLTMLELGNLEDLEGVLLTEEWLVKFGFEIKDKENGGHVVPTRKQLNEYLYCNKDGVVALVSELTGYKDFIIKEIQYVHQLQNLYYALTGHELPIKNT